MTRASLVVSGTEVLHRACARAGMTTELGRTRQGLANAELGRISANNTARDAVDTLARATVVAEHAAEQLGTARREVSTYRRLHQEALAELLEVRQTLGAALRERVRERDALQARLTSPPAAPTPDSNINEDDPMGISARFALLELD